MEFNWSILGWIAGLIFVYVFGLFEGRSKGYKQRKAEEAEEKKQTTEPKPVTVKVDDPGLLRIKSENGLLTLDLDGSRVDTAALSGEQRKRLIEMLNFMRPWLEGKPAPAPVMAPLPPPSQPKPVADTHQGPAIVSTPPPPQSAMDPIASRPISPRPATIAKEDRPAFTPTSIVGQIDQVLQARIAGTPLEERGVFLTQSPEGGVMVFVGLTKYLSIDEVPDTEIKAAIRAAISEWEDKYTPGL